MTHRVYNIYISVIKLAFFILAVLYLAILKEETLLEKQIIEIPLLFITISLLILYELVKQFKYIIIGAAAAALGLLIYYFGNMYYILLPIIILDGVTLLSTNLIAYLTAFIGVLGCKDKLTYSLSALFFIALYYQHYVIIKHYKNDMDSLMERETALLSTIDKQDLRHKSAVEKFALVYENKRLEEKGKLSQALHDKIGHSINGSIFQLEACKLLVGQKPEQTKEKLQQVIDSLRTSMDEIRIILRKEKPKAGEMKFIQLKSLCTDFKSKYGISVDFACEGDPNSVSEAVWELLLDNTVEAFSNALKYADCDRIAVHILVFSQLIRCTIKDNGKGCGYIKEGMGLSGMKERIRALGGTINITSEVGFEINMLLPLEKGEAS